MATLSQCTQCSCCSLRLFFIHFNFEAARRRASAFHCCYSTGQPCLLFCFLWPGHRCVRFVTVIDNLEAVLVSTCGTGNGEDGTSARPFCIQQGSTKALTEKNNVCLSGNRNLPSFQLVYRGSISNYKTCTGAFVVVVNPHYGGSTVSINLGNFMATLLTPTHQRTPLKICCSVNFVR